MIKTILICLFIYIVVFLALFFLCTPVFEMFGEGFVSGGILLCFGVVGYWKLQGKNR